VGAVIAGLCLKRHPQDAQSLSLIAAEADLAASEGLENRMKRIQSLIILRRLAALPLVRGLVLRRYSLGLLSPPARKELTHDFSHLNPRAAWETMGTALEETAFQEYLSGVSQVNVPVLLVACGKDQLTSVHNARKLFARIQRGRLVTMHGCGHFPMLEAPQKFAELLRDFLTLTEGSTPIQDLKSKI
jgi:pimeloyl-ACP methyl ester carboxylesterase